MSVPGNAFVFRAVVSWLIDWSLFSLLTKISLAGQLHLFISHFIQFFSYMNWPKKMSFDLLLYSQVSLSMTVLIYY